MNFSFCIYIIPRESKAVPKGLLSSGVRKYATGSTPAQSNAATMRIKLITDPSCVSRIKLKTKNDFIAKRIKKAAQQQRRFLLSAASEIIYHRDYF
jgi:hypothetical protein